MCGLVPKEFLPAPAIQGYNWHVQAREVCSCINVGGDSVKTCTNCFFEAPDNTRFCPNCGHVLPMPAPKKDDRHGLMGKTLAGKFVIHDCIGQGAMGSIYRAEQITLGKQVCIKVLHPHLVGDYELSKRFHREAKAASRLHHPNAINIIDFGTSEEGVHYIAMDFLQGRDLAHLLRDEFPLDPIRILYLVDQVCSALDEAHAQGIIHRDLKPENIMVEDRRHQKDFVTVLDFGIAKIIEPEAAAAETFHTRAGIVCGTPEYMSPEQAQGLELDARTDIYSLGIILYQLNTKKLPFTGETPIGVVTKHLTQTPIRPRVLNPEISPAMEELILRLMAKNRNERPASCMEIKALIDVLRKRLSQPVAVAGPEVMTQPSFGIPSTSGRPGLGTEPLAAAVKPVGAATTAQSAPVPGPAPSPTRAVPPAAPSYAQAPAAASYSGTPAAAQPSASTPRLTVNQQGSGSPSSADGYSGIRPPADRQIFEDRPHGTTGDGTTQEQEAVGHFQTMQAPKAVAASEPDLVYPSAGKRVAYVLLALGVVAALGVGGFALYKSITAENTPPAEQQAAQGVELQPASTVAADEAARLEAESLKKAEAEAQAKAKEAEEASRLAKEKEEQARQLELKLAQERQTAVAVEGVRETKEAYNTLEIRLKLRKEAYLLANRPERALEIDAAVALAVAAKVRLDELTVRIKTGPLDEAMDQQSKKEKADLDTLAAKVAPLFTEVLANPNAAAAQKKIESVSARITEQRTSLVALQKKLADKALEWDKAKNKKKVTEIEAISKEVGAVDTELGTMLGQLAPDTVDRLTEEFGRVRGKSETLFPKAETLLAETVTMPIDPGTVKVPVNNTNPKDPVPKDPNNGGTQNNGGNQNNQGTEKPPVDNSAEARRLEAAGDQEISQGNYLKGVLYYRESFKLVRNPAVAKKLGIAYNNKGDYQQGAEYLNLYLKMMEGKLSPDKVQMIQKLIRSN